MKKYKQNRKKAENIQMINNLKNQEKRQKEL